MDQPRIQTRGPRLSTAPLAASFRCNEFFKAGLVPALFVSLDESAHRLILVRNAAIAAGSLLF